MTLPVTTEDITLTWWADLDKAAGAVATLNDVLALQKLQEITGVKVEFQHPPVGSASEQFNLLVASNSLPDLVTYGWAGVQGGPGAFIKDEVIIALNEPIGKWAPNLTQFLEENEEVRKQQEMDDGTYYVFPAVYGDRDLACSQGPVIRLDMYEQMGFTLEDAPSTIDGWTELLRQVKDFDFGGNKVSPLFIAGKGQLDGAPMFLGAWGIRQEFYKDGDTIKFGGIQPEYKEFLTLFKQWYDEGILDPESLTGTAKIQDDKMAEDKIFMINGSMGNSITRYTAMMRPGNEKFRLYPLPYPTLVEGGPLPEIQEANAFTGGGVAITTGCKYVKEAVKMLDYDYSEDGHVLSNWGVEGVTFEKGADGLNKYTDLILNNPEGLSREQAMAKYTYWQSGAAVVKYKDVLNQRDSLPEQIEGRKNWMLSPNNSRIPPLTPTQEESKEYADIMNEVRTYTTEMFNQFVSGKASLDTYDKYVETVKGMGIDRATAINQAQYDRFDARP
ncbi:sugar ABC transporter permease [Clostridia bacterium]|nr:sugar ABC transporter permease [Clostridia bacterium]